MLLEYWAICLKNKGDTLQRHNKIQAINQLTRLKQQAQVLASRSLSEKKKIAFSQWHTATESALRNYFGQQSPHYQTFIATDFKLIPDQPKTPRGSVSTKDHRTAMRSTSAMLVSLIKEIQQHWPDDETQPIDIGDFWQIIHPTIKDQSQPRFKDGYYADAVSAALRIIEEQVKHKAKLTDQSLTGSKVMTEAFSPKNPILAIPTEQKSNVKSVQQGYMFMFTG